MTYNIQQSPKSFALAKDLVWIATNVEYGDLRSDMITSRIIKETKEVGATPADSIEFIARLMGALESALLTIEVLSDDVAENAARNAKAQAVADDPRFKDRLDAMAGELAASREKPLRRLSIVDDHLRSLDD